MPPQVTYALADLDALRAIGPNDRTNGYSRLLEGDKKGKPAWYTFISSSTEQDDGDFVIISLDNPSAGRWLKTNIQSVADNTKWKIIKSSVYDAQSGDSIVADIVSVENNIYVNLPSSPKAGDIVKFISTASGAYLIINLNGSPYNRNSFDRLHCNVSFKELFLVYVDELTGWIPNSYNDFVGSSSSSPE